MFSYVGAESANKALRFVAAVVLARALSVSSYGLVNVAIAVSGVMVMIASLGLSELGVREVAVTPRRTSWLTGRVIAVRVSGVLAIAGVLTGIAVSVSMTLLWVCVALTLMALAMAISAEWVLRGTERLGMLGVADLAGGAAVLGGSLLLALTRPGPALAVAVFACGEIVTAALCWRAVGREARPGVALQGVKDLLRRSWPLGLSSLAFYAYYANVDTILLAATRSDREAGLYTAAYRIFLAANLVAIAAAYAQLPVLSRAVDSGLDTAANRTLRRNLTLLACYGALVVGFAEVGGGVLLRVLYGHDYGSMASVLTVLCLGVAWYAVGFPTGYTLIARRRNGGFLAGAATAALLNLSLNAVLIPITGAIGAATATCVAFIAACIVWMKMHHMLDLNGLPVILALSVMSLGGVMAVLVPDARPFAGVATVAGGTLALVWNHDALGTLRTFTSLAASPGRR